jgi:hypothetical protein
MLENRIFVGDSATLSASIEGDTGAPITLSAIDWEVLRPDGSNLVVANLPVGAPTGSTYVLSAQDEGFPPWTTVQWDGENWNTIPGTANQISADGEEGILIIPGVAIKQAGLYRGRAKCNLPDGTTRSVLMNFEAYDPFESSMPVELPATQYFTNQFITSVLTIKDSQAKVAGIDIGGSVTLTDPVLGSFTAPDPASTESVTVQAVGGASTFTTNTYEYLISYRCAIGAAGNYLEGYAGLPSTVALDSTNKAQIVFTTTLDPSLSRVIYRRVANGSDWDVVGVADNTAQTWTDSGSFIGRYPPGAWYGSSDFAVTFYAENVGNYSIGAVVQFSVGGPQNRVFTAERTLTSNTQVYDPSILNAPVNTVPTRIVDHAWMKLEDLFDSELGGPWLTDESIKSFNKDKLALLLPDALYLVNNEYQPITNFTEETWPEDHIPLASQALMVEGIYHLIRSYVEQPLPSGGTLNWYDRRDYVTRWQSVLQKEEDKLMHLADKFKLAFTGFGATSMIVGGYATPITRMSRFWRTRYPRYIGPWGF